MLRTPPKKRKHYSQESLSAALEAVKKGMPVRKAFVSFGVSRSTLRDWVNGKIVHGTKRGPRPFSSTSEETELSQFLVDGVLKTVRVRSLRTVVCHVAVLM